MKKLAIFMLLTPFFATSSENIFDKMDDETAVTTGIYKLSSDEKQALANWLKYSEKEIIKRDKKQNMGFNTSESDREEIHSEIMGEFNGWRGNNIFKLENGQIWAQAEKTTFYIPKRTNPKITIKPRSLGSWVLYVDGFGRGVKVKRTK